MNMKLENMSFLCNNMGVADEVETIDMTPSWQTAITIYFEAIRSHIKASGLSNVLTAQKEMTRLALGFDKANNLLESRLLLIEELTQERDEAREAYKSMRDTICDLDPVEINNSDYYEVDDIDNTVHTMCNQITEWA
jgi:hypothetical protein